MNCTDFEDRLHAQFGTVHFDESTDLTDHAGHCPACRMTLEQFRLLSDSLGMWRELVPDVDLTNAVVSAHQSQAQSISAPEDDGRVVMPRRDNGSSPSRTQPPLRAGIVARPYAFPSWLMSRRRTLWLAAGSLVGLLIFAVVLPGLLKEAPPEVVDPQVAKTPVPADLHSTQDAARPVEKVNPAAGHPPAVPERARDVYHDLAQKAAGALGEVTVFVMPGSSLPPMSPSAERPEGTAGWIDGVKHQLKPIGRSLDDAFDFLWAAGQSADSSKT